MLRGVLLSTVALATSGTAGELDLSGSVRARYEALDGQFRPGFNAKHDLFSIRTTLLAGYEAGAWRFGAELFDSRAYGARSEVRSAPERLMRWNWCRPT